MTAKLRCIVVGYGSIGLRHTKILNGLGYQVSVVSRRQIDYPDTYLDIKDAISKVQPHYIVVANETSKHEETLMKISEVGYNQKVLVEKPLFLTDSINTFNIKEIYVAYNLRFHPLIQALYEKLQGIQVVSVQSYVGQYLPTWRPGTDYSKSYSASKEKGGGVLRDLSHELDYLQFLFGRWRAMTAMGGKFSNLEIDSEDHFSIMYNTKEVPIINLQMNYMDFMKQRFIIVNTNEKTYKADFIQNTLQINEHVIQFKNNRNDTYTLQHLAVLNNERTKLCSFGEGLDIVQMIAMAEKSSEEKVWVFNE